MTVLTQDLRRLTPLACVIALVTTLGPPATIVKAGTSSRRPQIITLTESMAALTWVTNKRARAAVRYGNAPDRLDRVAVGGSEPVRFHYFELRGLQPGSTYYYACTTSLEEPVAERSPSERFTTLVLPQGKELFAFATMTDTHVGEHVVARIVISPDTVISEGVRWREPGLPHWRLMLQTSIRQINRQDVAFTIVKGDITHHGTVSQFQIAKDLMDRLVNPYHIVRGNHDRLEPLLRTFDMDRTWYSFKSMGHLFVVLDTEPFASAPGQTLDAQLEWLANELDMNGDAPTYVFVHRPIPPRLSGATGPVHDMMFKLQHDLARRWIGKGAAHTIARAQGKVPSVRPDSARRLAELFRRHGKIVGVFAGHLHRNHVGYWPGQTGNLPYVETAPTKDYPCGYGVTRVFSGGYMHNFYTPSDPHSLEWSAMSHDQFASFGFANKSGTVYDRNFVLNFSDLDLRRSGTNRSERNRPAAMP